MQTSAMLDVLGIVQHHDAITGTAKQAVADDYNLKVYKAITDNDVVYKKSLGLDNWMTCNRTNATYKECPISNFDTSKTTYVAVHNPSNIPME